MLATGQCEFVWRTDDGLLCQLADRLVFVIDEHTVWSIIATVPAAIASDGSGLRVCWQHEQREVSSHAGFSTPSCRTRWTIRILVCIRVGCFAATRSMD